MYLCLRLTLMDGSHSSSESLFSQAAPLASSSHLTADSFLSHNCCITAAHSVITQVLPFSKSFFFLFFSVKSQGTIYIFFFFYFTSLQHLSDGSRYYPRWQKNVYITAPCQIKKSHPKLIKSNYSKMYKVHHQAAADLSMHQYENSIT